MVTDDHGKPVRGGEPPQAFDLPLPLQLRPSSAAARRAFANCVEGGRRRGPQRSRAEIVSVDGVPPNEYLLRVKAEAVRRALLSCIPPDRLDLLDRGLSVLDPSDQHPGDILAWLGNPDARTLILAGPTGNGKTQAGYAMQVHAATAGAAMRDGRGCVEVRPLVCRAIDVNSYIASLRPDGSAEPAWKLRDQVYSCELLLGDDLGAELDSEEMTVFMRTELANLQTYRQDRRLRTIWTTNRRGSELKKMVGSRMWSRLHKDVTTITFKGPDRRKLSMEKELDW